MRGLLSIIAAGLLLTACGPHDHPPRPKGKLPAVAGAAYRVSLATYDNDYCDNPFNLYVETVPPLLEGEEPSELLRAGPMCKNVDVIQTPDRLYVFYDVLSIRYFNSNRFRPEPHPILCDLALQACREERARLLAEGGKAYNVCSCRDPSPDVIEPFPPKESTK